MIDYQSLITVFPELNAIEFFSIQFTLGNNGVALWNFKQHACLGHSLLFVFFEERLSILFRDISATGSAIASC